MTDYDRQQETSPTVETASATTSKDNTSGSLAYVIAAAAVAALFCLGLGLSGCVSLFTRIASSEHAHNTTTTSPFDDLDHYFEDDDSTNVDDQDILNLLDNGDATPQGESPQLDTGTSVSDALSSDLAVYGDTIDTLLSAFDYAGAQSSVSECARDIVRTDKQATSELVGILRSAARGDITQADAFQKAIELADATAEELDATELASAEGDHAEDIERELEKARSSAVERWQAIGDEMSLFAETEKLGREQLSSAEGAITSPTSEAAQHLSTALTTSAKH